MTLRERLARAKQKAYTNMGGQNSNAFESEFQMGNMPNNNAEFEPQSNRFVDGFKNRMGSIGNAIGGASIGGAISGIQNFINQRPKQRFGTSALQQAMIQEKSGNRTALGAELLDRYKRDDPYEIERQQLAMDQGLKGNNPIMMDDGAMAEPLNENLTPESQDKVEMLGLDRLMEGSDSLNEEGIKRLQDLLNEKGFTDMYGNKLAVDGGMGRLTRSAMEKYGQSVAGYGDPKGEPLDPVTSYYTTDAVTGKRVPTGKPRRFSDPFGLVNSEVADIQNTIGNPENNPDPRPQDYDLTGSSLGGYVRNFGDGVLDPNAFRK